MNGLNTLERARHSSINSKCVSEYLTLKKKKSGSGTLWKYLIFRCATARRETSKRRNGLQ